MKTPSLLVIFLTVFVDLIGFGLVLPLLPNYTRSFGASGLEVGCIIAAYSLMQFIFAPAWGALSDRIGRRPVLLISTAGNAASYAIFALGSAMTGRPALYVILLSRVFAGVCGANITVAQAYIADITPAADRSKRMGLIGMAFGLGFIVGPALAVVTRHFFGVTGPGWSAAAICAANFFLAAWLLPESWKPGTANAAPRARFAHFRHMASRPLVGFLVLVFFLATFGFACFECTMGLLIQRNFQLDDHASARSNAILFCFCGVIGTFVQAGPIGRLVKRLGEPRLIASSLVIFGLSLLPLPFIYGHDMLRWATLMSAGGGAWWLLLFAVGWVAVGSGLTRPPLFGLLSNLTPANEQGATLGLAQSAGSLARVLGPPFSGFLFDRHPSWPYVFCGVVVFITGLVAWPKLVGSSAVPRVASAVH